jgi:hypothetical protein
MTVVAFAFIAVIVFAGRVNVGSAHAEAAARAAARTISIARDPQSAVAAARTEASEIVDEGSAMCTHMGFHPTVTAVQVTVTVDCSVDVAEAVYLAKVPATMHVSGQATEIIDVYREKV